MASMGFEAGVPTGAFDAIVDTGKTLARRGQMGDTLTTDEEWQIFDAGINLMVNLPSVGPHFAIAYVPVGRLELSVRYAGAAYRGGVRYQFLDHTNGPFDLTLGAGVSRFSFEFPLSDQIPGLELEDFSRWQVDVPLLIGTSRDYFRVWAGPKVLFTTFDTALKLTLPNDQILATFDGNSAFVGGQGGVALGYKHAFVAFELTIMKTFGTAHLSAPALGTHDTNLSTLVVFPSLGLIIEI
jgi:hypothetical protein